MKQKHESCPHCGNRTFEYDKMDLMGDGVEEHFGKTMVLCGNKSSCGKFIEYLEDE